MYGAGTLGIAVDSTLAAGEVPALATIYVLHRAFDHLPPAKIKPKLKSRSVIGPAITSRASSPIESVGKRWS